MPDFNIGSGAITNVQEGPDISMLQAIMAANPDVGENVAQQMAREASGVAPSGRSGGDIIR